MRLVRLLLAGLVLVPATLAGTIHPLKGDAFKAEILSVTDKEVTYEKGGEKKTVPIAGVLKIEYRDVGRPGKDAKYSMIELTDGSILLAEKVGIRKKMLEVTLLSGPAVKVPIATVANVLINGHEENFRTDWKNRKLNARGREALVINNEGKIATISATLGDGDAKGEAISVAITIGDDVITKQRKLSEQHGLIFKHVLDAKASPVLFKLSDTIGNELMVASLKALDGGGMEVTTQSGAVIEFTPPQLARLDYTKGKLDQLADLVPVSVVSGSNLDEEGKPDQWHVFKDTNLNKGPLTLGGVVYTKGLAIKPKTVLTYDIKGEYRELSMLVGIDDNVTADGGTTLTIEGDGKEISKVTISSADKIRFKPLVLNVKDVQKLKITVEADGDFDTSRHLDLADAKVSK